jgi:hypothetical protein
MLCVMAHKAGVVARLGAREVGVPVTRAESRANAAYIAHVANAYPRLVQSTKDLIALLRIAAQQGAELKGSKTSDALALLRELGEEG